jgi:dUTP pyrophosphatase
MTMMPKKGRNLMRVKIKKKHPDVLTPVYKTLGSAGCDVCSDEDVVLHPGERALVGTGLFLEVPDGYECQCRPRSGLALTTGVTLLNSPGTIDSDYRGEMKVLLINTSNSEQHIIRGQRIAQFVFAPVAQVLFEVVDELSETQRGVGGWGSTGK